MALRDRAVSGVEDLVSVLGAGRVVGVAVPADDEVRGVLGRIGRFDVSGLSADARRLAAVHRVVADQMHRLPEQQVRLDHGWSAGAGVAAVTLVIDHQRRAESDLAVLRSVSEATSAAAAGIDQILRTWYLTLARLSAPLVAGVALPDLPAAVLSGQIPPAAVAADITSRLGVLNSTAQATQRGIEAILTTLTRSADEWDGAPPPGLARDDEPTLLVDGTKERAADTGGSDSTTEPREESKRIDGPGIEGESTGGGATGDELTRPAVGVAQGVITAPPTPSVAHPDATSPSVTDLPAPGATEPKADVEPKSGIEPKSDIEPGSDIQPGPDLPLTLSAEDTPRMPGTESDLALAGEQ